MVDTKPADTTNDHQNLQTPSPEHYRFLSKVRRRRITISWIRVGVVIFIIALWELSARFGWVNSFITSSPARVWNMVVSMVRSGELWVHLGWTTAETVAGFTLGTAIGIIVAIFLWWSDFVSRVVEPYIVILQSIPKVALGPIFIVWLGTNVDAIIAMALAISVIVTILMVHTGFREVDPNKIKLLKTFGATKWQILRLVVLPASIPTMIGALKVNVGLSMVGVITGEFLVSKAGLGYLIVYGGQVFNMTLVMSGVIILCILSALLYYLVSWIESRIAQGRE